MNPNIFFIYKLTAKLNEAVRYQAWSRCRDFPSFVRNVGERKIIISHLIELADEMDRLDKAFKREHSDIRWNLFRLVRNIGADTESIQELDAIWKIVRFLPRFRRKIARLKREMKSQ